MNTIMINWDCAGLNYIYIKPHGYYQYTLENKLNAHFNNKGLHIKLERFIVFGAMEYEDGVLSMEHTNVYKVFINGEDEGDRLLNSHTINVDDTVESIIIQIEWRKNPKF